jgi:hypothetical protein
MRKIVTLLAMLGMITLFTMTGSRQAEARPQYLKAFSGKYAKVADKAGQLKCGVCHGAGGKNKKVVSDYGKALAKALGGKNVKDNGKIEEALDEAAKADAGNGKTFGDLLDSGELPAPAAE